MLSRKSAEVLPYRLVRLLPRRGRFRLAGGTRPDDSRERPVTMRLRGGLTMRLDLGDRLQRLVAADCHERAEEDVTVGLLRPGDSVIDVGANIGYLSLRWAQAVAPGGNVFAFEPAPPNFGALTANLALNPGLAVQAQRLAVGQGPAELHISADRPGATSGSYSFNNRTPGGFTVEQQSLDDWAGGRDLGRLRLIKVDVEGMEADVIAGARGTISAHRPYLMLEWNSGHPGTEPLYEAIRRLTADHGYRTQVVDRSAVLGMGHLSALPDDHLSWPELCNLVLSPPGSAPG